MGRGLFPDQYRATLADIDFAALGPHTNVIIDVDNTLVRRSHLRVAPETVALLRLAHERGYVSRMCVVSNVVAPSRERVARVADIARQLGCPYVCAYGLQAKPNPKPFRRAMRLMGSVPETTAVIGDQIYTDVRGGNALGLYTVWVSPLGRDAWFTWIRRWQERKVRKAMEDLAARKS